MNHQAQAVAGMNRAQRCAMKRGKLQPAERLVPLPAPLDEFTVFDMAQTILDKISNGEIEAKRGEPIFYDNTGKECYVCPALDGWIYTWQMINEKLGTNLNLLPIGRIHNKLAASMPITEAEVEAAKDTLYAMRLVFRASDRSRIASIARTAQIRILMEG